MCVILQAILIDCPVSDFEHSLVSSNGWCNGIRYAQRRATTIASKGHLTVRGPSEWNKLPFSITSSQSL